MKLISLVLLLILLSLNHATEEVSSFKLNSFTKYFLSYLNDLLKPITIRQINKRCGKVLTDNSIGVFFRRAISKDINVSLENNEIHLRVSNLTAITSARFFSRDFRSICQNPPPFFSNFKFSKGEGKIKMDIDLKLKLVNEGTDMTEIEITYFRINYDLSYIFGDAKSPRLYLKKEVENKILDKMAKSEFQKILDEIVQKLVKMKKLNK